MAAIKEIREHEELQRSIEFFHNLPVHRRRDFLISKVPFQRIVRDITSGNRQDRDGDIFMDQDSQEDQEGLPLTALEQHFCKLIKRWKTAIRSYSNRIKDGTSHEMKAFLRLGKRRVGALYKDIATFAEANPSFKNQVPPAHHF
jgi:hypothetical protein